MLAVQIILHSIRLILRNWRSLLQIFAVPLALLIISAIVGQNYMREMMEQSRPASQISVGPVMLGNLAAVLAFLWAAVAWHRFVLLNERPAPLPPVRPMRILAYLGYTLLIALMLAALLFPAMFLVGAIASGSPLSARVILLVFLTAASTLALRLAVALPGVAIGEPQPLQRALVATSGTWGTLALIVIVGIVVENLLGTLLVQLALKLGSEGATTMAVIAGLRDGLGTMLSLSVLTTLHGYYVQGRSLG